MPIKIKVNCAKCGKEIEIPPEQLQDGVVAIGMEEQYYYCTECRDELKEWMGGS